MWDIPIESLVVWWYSFAAMKPMQSSVRTNLMHAHAHPELIDPVE
jgi:hypothetical protein